MQRVISLVESNKVPSQSKTIRSNWRGIMTAPRPWRTPADPPRGSSPAGPGRGPFVALGGPALGLVAASLSFRAQGLEKRLAFCGQRRFELHHLAAGGGQEAQQAGGQEHALEMRLSPPQGLVQGEV